MRRRLSRLRDEDGLTTVEVLVAAFILAIGIGSTIVVLNASGKTGSTAERHQSGVAIAQQEIEKIRALPYSQVGMSSVTWPSNGKPDDPTTRITGGKFRALPGTTPLDENFVAGTDCTPNCLVAPATTGISAGNATATIYRFVSWRDEECGLLGSGQFGLLSGLVGPGGLASSVATLLTALGTNGSLNTLISNISAANSNLSGLVSSLGSLLGALLGTTNSILQIGNALNTVTGISNQVLAAINPLLTGGLLTQLQAIGNLTQLDLCDMDLTALKKLKTLNTLLTTAKPLLTSLQSQIPAVATQFGNAGNVHCSGLLGCILNGLLGSVLTPVLNTLQGPPPLADNLKNAINALLPLNGGSSVLTDLKNLDLTGVVAGLTRNTDKNTKRVQVAVVLDPAGPAGPLAPIWMSTIVTDPTAGLLTG